MRYLIASLLSPASNQSIRQAYPSCSIKTLHLTFIPPFTTTDPTLLTPLPLLNQTRYTTDQPNIFDRGRQILYYPLVPPQPLTQYFNLLLPRIQSRIHFESPDFTPNTIPSFLPHITLDYDFDSKLNLNLPTLDIDLLQPQLLSELQPGIWQPYDL